jgi:hypothetical protein
MRLKFVFVAVLSGIGLAASAADANAGSGGYIIATDIAIETIEDVTHGDLRKLVAFGTWIQDWDGASKYTQSWGCNSPTCAPSATPLPAALPLYGVGLGAIGLLSWYRKRKSKAKPNQANAASTT